MNPSAVAIHNHLTHTISFPETPGKNLESPLTLPAFGVAARLILHSIPARFRRYIDVGADTMVLLKNVSSIYDLVDFNQRSFLSM